jgi:hypothetical protein
MRNLIFILLSLIPFFVKSQTCPVAYDYMEVYDWFGNWNVGAPANTGFYTNVSISPSVSAVIFGSGNGASGLEAANYIMPNLNFINSAYAHRFSFRLGSYKFSNPTAATAGVDGPDYIDVRYSTNGGVTYVTEMRIAGNSNAYWNYNTLGVASKTANGVLTTYAPVAGGDRTLTGDGYSVIELIIPPGATQLAFSLNCRVNSAGEEFWIDNIELTQLAPCVSLPIELISFTGYNDVGKSNILNWITATEINNDYFTIDRSIDGINWLTISQVDGAGNSSVSNYYEYKDFTYIRNNVNYYRLSQTDNDGKKEYFPIIAVESGNDIEDCHTYEYYDLLGNKVDYRYAPSGLYLRLCVENKEVLKVVKVQ